MGFGGGELIKSCVMLEQWWHDAGATVRRNLTSKGKGEALARW